MTAKETNFTPTQQSHTLPSGRKLSYYTFPTKENQSSQTEKPDKPNRHPILYFHGFPGCGLEASFCAAEAAKANCDIYAPDRPGFGHSDPMESTAPDDIIDQIVRDMWDFVESMHWTAFSVVGVSGGGPYTLAFLESYLSSFSKPPAVLRGVSVVAGVFCSVGVQGMLPGLQRLYDLASGARDSLVSWMGLRMNFSVLGFFVKYRNSLPGFPDENLPEVDQESMSEMKEVWIEILRGALRQGSRAAALEATVIFRDKQRLEEPLKKCCATGGTALVHGGEFPRVTFFHGLLDKNVPISHSRYVFIRIMQEASFAEMKVYTDMGHASLVCQKANDYIQAVLPVTNKG